MSPGTLLQVKRNDIPLFQIWGVDGLPRAKVTMFYQTNGSLKIGDISRQLRKYQACVYCGFCEAACQMGAICVQSDIKEWNINEKLCTHCMDCLQSKRIKGGCIAVSTTYGKVNTDSKANNK